jgi:hypothetical protein
MTAILGGARTSEQFAPRPPLLELVKPPLTWPCFHPVFRGWRTLVVVMNACGKQPVDALTGGKLMKTSSST